ncbi:hypothetical protein RSOLAG22IIIB_05727 [Rhizoctonia solani]|uniref:Laminin domain protein n=1 Tax=Rhizoctonia solani TaxID=456999 RepID=A0A0K6G885_9AGAM|nr:hypothetical protein RSOLAG22IIIB_05727 [Rhizoctonia solani]
MASVRIVPNQTILTPPDLPSYLRAVQDLQPIVGKPTDEEIKAIHAVIRALNSIVHLYTVYDPNLSVQLSQHLFGAQMGTYRISSQLLDDPIIKGYIHTSNSTFTHPKYAQPNRRHAIKSRHSISAKCAEKCRKLGPRLFDADLNMRLSQHLFDLQFARYMHDLTQDQSPSGSGPEPLPVPEPVEEPQYISSVDPPAPNLESGEEINTPIPQPEQIPETHSGLAQLSEIMKETRDATRESKVVLENMNRVLMSIKRDQCMTIPSDTDSVVQKDPLNQRGVLASECGLPPLRCTYDPTYRGGCSDMTLSDDDLVRYLKFFDTGADLINEGEKIEDRDAAISLVLAQAGLW